MFFTPTTVLKKEKTSRHGRMESNQHMRGLKELLTTPGRPGLADICVLPDLPHDFGKREVRTGRDLVQELPCDLFIPEQIVHLGEN
jgi:hypothetical protein